MTAPAAAWQYNSPEHLLEEQFRISTGFHPGQRDIIEQLVQGKRVLAIQRTGWGKSLCYQMASLYYPHITIVFSPAKRSCGTNASAATKPMPSPPLSSVPTL